MAEVDHRPDLRLAGVLAAIAVGSPALLVAWALAVRERLPEPVAHHWGADGSADAFSSLGAALALATVLPLLLAVPIGAAAVVGRQPDAMRRMLAAMAAGLPVFVVVLVADSLRVQLDLVDAAAAPLPGVGIGAGVGLGVVAGVVAAGAVTSRASAARAGAPPPSDAARLPDGGADLVWHGTTSLSRSVAVLGFVVGIGLIALSAALTPWMLAIALPVAVVIGASLRLTTTIDPSGLAVRSGPVRLLRVPIDEVAEADVTEVDPFWEFGGWGLRVDVHGRTGVVSRKGEALRVRRGDGSEVVVTVDDAATAAATLNTAADRAR